MIYHILEKDSEEDLAHKSQHPRQCFHKKKDNAIFEEREGDIHQSKGSHYGSRDGSLLTCGI